MCARPRGNGSRSLNRAVVSSKLATLRLNSVYKHINSPSKTKMLEHDMICRLHLKNLLPVSNISKYFLFVS